MQKYNIIILLVEKKCEKLTIFFYISTTTIEKFNINTYIKKYINICMHETKIPIFREEKNENNN